MSLTTVKDALDIILNNTQDFGTEIIDFEKSLGRVLKENIVADRDFPPFNRVSMDGIAINSEAFKNGQTCFKIEGIQAAGDAQKTLKDSNNCLEAMTGAVLPKNTDAVVQYELLKIENGIATLQTDAIKDFQNIHKKGLDRKQGDILIKQNTKISAAEIGVFATVGKTQVKVAKQPKVMIISTGNELVEVAEKPADFQIRRSNVFTLVAHLNNLNIDVKTAHIQDDKEILIQKIETYLNEFDVLLFSGAVSKGKLDFIPEVLDNLGVKKLFHRVKQRPGKPFWFGKKGTKTVFAFPGNPVSTYVSCLKYFYPWHQKSVGLNLENENKAILAEDFYFKPDLTYFLQVTLKNIEGKLMAIPVSGKGSGDLANLVDADAFLELPDDKSNFTKGEIFPIITYR
jgi:molybdopterin molybdotransferase